MTNEPRVSSPELDEEEDNRFNRKEASDVDADDDSLGNRRDPAGDPSQSLRAQGNQGPSRPVIDRALGFERLVPERILGAVEALGFETSGHWFSLHCLENRVYDVRLEDERHLIAKFYRPGRWSREAILEEHRFLSDLEAAEVPAVCPLSVDGETLFELDGFKYALWPRVGGRSPEELSNEELDILGRVVARMHNVGASREAPSRVRLTSETYARGPLAYLVERFVPFHLSERYSAVVSDVAALFDEIVAGVPVHRVHGDCHLGNLLRNQNAWFFVDFDDCVTGPAAQDLWLLVPSQDAEGQRQRRRIVESYRQIRDFEDRWTLLFEPLRALRFVHYSAWVGRRIHEPAFASAFPDYATETYWLKEISDLEARIRVIERSLGERR
ncbi:MAG: serine/threonine protein kinase [Deltaproteobacteria bacterium]|nr:serine/threonine protein kinase [Deltaproteobacteria bacterium]